ncbi:MAG: SpoIIE family protein phosphatase [Nitratireductor sp.]|nr:SpoIIE family protein phosphatase [Nitratireductor sp.]
MLISRFEGSATLDNVRHLRSLFTAERLGLRVRQEVLDDCCLAVSELATNAISYSASPPGQMTMQVFAEGTMLRIELTDDGDKFDQFERYWAEGQLAPMDPLSESGRGMWLIRNSVDRLAYEHVSAHGSGINKWNLWRSITKSAKPSILLVEDDEPTRGMFVTTLSKMANVSCATSLAEARAVLAGSNFDLVIADFNLGDGNTADLLEDFRLGNTALEMPFIFVTGDRSGQARQSGLRHGIHTVLQKPVRPRELLERAHEAIAASHVQEARASRRVVGNIDPLVEMLEPGTVMDFRIAAGAAVASTGGGDVFASLGCSAEGGSERHRFAIADCVGHGMPARLQATLLQGLMTGLSFRSGNDAGGFLGALSDLIHSEKAARQLIATVLVVDLLGDHHLQLVTGGHPSPMIISPDGRMRPVGLRGNLPGLLPDTRIDPLTLQLARGERLLMATDGVAPQSAEMLDGIPKTVSVVLRKSPTMRIEQVSEMLCEALREALGPYPMDDWTFVLVERSDFTPARP